MGNVFLMSEGFGQLILFLLVASPIAFVVGLILLAASKKTRKAGIITMTCSVIAFIIGFGTCFANLNLGGMH